MAHVWETLAAKYSLLSSTFTPMCRFCCKIDYLILLRSTLSLEKMQSMVGINSGLPFIKIVYESLARLALNPF